MSGYVSEKIIEQIPLTKGTGLVKASMAVSLGHGSYWHCQRSTNNRGSARRNSRKDRGGKRADFCMVHTFGGDLTALNEIWAGQAFITPNQYREFLAGGARRRGFLELESIQLFAGEEAGHVANSGPFQNVFREISPVHGRGDAALAPFAHATGYEVVTREQRLVKFIRKTMMNPDTAIIVSDTSSQKTISRRNGAKTVNGAVSWI